MNKLDLSDRCILVVEDEFSNYQLLEIILRKNNAKILWAKDGIEAIEIFDETPCIDLILMDIRMPRMNGIEATKAIRLKNEHIPIIAQTAYTLDEDIQNTLKAGCNDHISKPLDIGLLLLKIETLLNRQSIN